MWSSSLPSESPAERSVHCAYSSRCEIIPQRSGLYRLRDHRLHAGRRRTVVKFQRQLPVASCGRPAPPGIKWPKRMLLLISICKLVYAPCFSLFTAASPGSGCLDRRALRDFALEWRCLIIGIHVRLAMASQFNDKRDYSSQTDHTYACSQSNRHYCR